MIVLLLDSQQSHSWAFTLRKPNFKKTQVSPCSSQHYVQWPGHGRNSFFIDIFKAITFIATYGESLSAG